MSQNDINNQTLAAALAGLMGIMPVGCGEDSEREKIVEVEKEKLVEIEAKPPIITLTTVDRALTLPAFKENCSARGGWVQTHASCAGANSCAGVSYHTSSGKLSEHTCRAMNICAGMSCVDLAKDQGLTGQQILEGTDGTKPVGSEIQCNFCHGSGKTSFVLPIAPGVDPAAATLEFQARSNAALVSVIAFGIHGVNTDGTAFANMSGFFKSYSLREVNAVVDHIRTLPVVAKDWGM